MKRYCFTFFILVLLSIASSAQPVRPLAITNVTVIDATGKPAQRGMTVLIQGNRITKLSRTDKIKLPANTERIDASGKFLIPGLWDMHIHLTYQPDQLLTREWMMPLLIAYGVIGVRDMGGDWQRIQQLKQEIATGKLIGPRIMAPGPFVDGPGFVDQPVTTINEARQKIRELKTLGVDFVKVQANLSPENYRAVMAEAKRLKMNVAGHVPEAISAFEVASAGQRSIEHTSPILAGDAGILLSCSSQEDALRNELLAFKRDSEAPNANRPELRRRQRNLQAQMIDTYAPGKCQKLFALLKQNKVWVVPTQFWARRLAPLNASDAIDSEAETLLPLKTRTTFVQQRNEAIKITAQETFVLRQRIAEKTRDLVQAMHQAQVPMLAGTDALDGDVLPGLSLHQELELMVQAGLSPMEALQSATLNAAQFFGEERTSGTIEAGKLADLILLDGDPLQNISNTKKIHAVITQGRLISAPERLALLEKVKAFVNAH